MDIECNPRPSILILSLEAEDYIYRLSSSPQKIRGGPAFFIKKVFNKLNIDYRIANYEFAEVEIKITEQGEVGRILKPGKIVLPNEIKEPNILISTIAPSNLDLSFLLNYNGDVFVDLQGFIRCEEEGKFGKKKIWQINEKVANKISVLKGTSEELSFVPKTIIEIAKEKIVLETRGANGIILWEAGRSTAFTPSLVIKTDNAIGAGDTFMAAFTGNFVQNKNVKESIKFALNYTSNFLIK